MKKVLKNVLKWLLLVWISYSLICTGLISLEQNGLAEAISYRTQNIDGFDLEKIEISELEEICKNYQEIADKAMNDDESIINAEYLSESEKVKLLEEYKIFRKYPSGYTMFVRDIAMWEGMTDLHITSFIMGVVVGTAIYLMLDKDKNGLKIVIAIYILFILILGFIEGIGSVAGDNLTLLDRWMFPETYIIPVTAVFALVVATRVIKQKEIAKKLNKKLNEKKEEKNK